MAKAEPLRKGRVDLMGVVTPRVTRYSICKEFLRGKGIFLPDMIDIPAAVDSAAGARFVETCIESSVTGNGWVDML